MAQTADQSPQVYTPATLARRWDCSERHVRNLIEIGALTAFRLGGKLLRIRTEDVEHYEWQNIASAGSKADLSSPGATKTDAATVTVLSPETRLRLAAKRRESTES